MTNSTACNIYINEAFIINKFPFIIIIWSFKVLPADLRGFSLIEFNIVYASVLFIYVMWQMSIQYMSNNM